MSRRVSPRAYAALALVTALTLSACSSTDSDEAQPSAQTGDTASASSDAATATDDSALSSGDAAQATDDSAAATGDSAAASADPALALTSSDDTFTLDVPPGWSDAIDIVPDDALLAAQSDTQAFGFFDNVVVTDHESVENLKEMVAATANVLDTDGTEVTELSPVDVDGESAYGYATISEVDGMTLTQEQRFVQRADTQYVVTFSTSEGEGEDNNLVNRQFDSILESWRWGTPGR